MNEVLSLLADYHGILVEGLLTTLAVSLIAILLGLLLGGPLALGVTSGVRIVAVPTRGFIELMRSLPFVLVLLIVHFGTQIAIGRIPGTVTGTFALAFYGSVYFAEALRTAYAAVPRGQREAAAALGLRPTIIFLKVIAPQMVLVFASTGRVVAVMLLKESAVLSIITVPELTHAALRIQASSFATIPTFILLTAFYWAAVSLLTWLAVAFERLFRRVPPTPKPRKPHRRKGVGGDRISTPVAGRLIS